MVWLQRTLIRCRKVSITIPQLSPTHTKTRIYKWTSEDDSKPPLTVEPYQVLCVVECSKDLLQEENRSSNNENPLMILESQEEGNVTIYDEILKTSVAQIDKDKAPWYNVGYKIGEIDDGMEEDGDTDKVMEWTWQAYTYSSDKDLE